MSSLCTNCNDGCELEDPDLGCDHCRRVEREDRRRQALLREKIRARQNRRAPNPTWWRHRGR